MKIKLTYADGSTIIVDVPDATIAMTADQMYRQQESAKMLAAMEKKGPAVQAERVE